MFILKNVSVTREQSMIVDNISLSFASGSTHILLGKNGAGKSSLTLALMGHPAYTVSGNAFLFGTDLLALPPHERSKQGLFLSFQQSPEIPGVKAETFLYEMCRSHGFLFDSITDFYHQVKPLLQLVDLPESLLGRELNHGFSGGEKKRFELLQLLLLKPKVALLDEPDSGLDRDAMYALFSVIKHIRTICPEMILLIITHYQQLLTQIKPDAVHVMKSGKIIVSGSAQLADHIFQEGYHTVCNTQNNTESL
jgi:Fe-S cluster assembly ATP-binding protein